MEQIVVRQLLNRLTSADLLPTLQSGYRVCHSTETAVLHVLSDILSTVDCGHVAALVLLDLLAAFDTVDHDILLQRLRLSFGINDTARRWFPSYLSGGTQHVRRGTNWSLIAHLICGIPQGSVLGPVLFVLCTVDLIQLTERHGLSAHLYADATQVYGSCKPTDVFVLNDADQKCRGKIWLDEKRLQTNPTKQKFFGE